VSRVLGCEEKCGRLSNKAGGCECDLGGGLESVLCRIALCVRVWGSGLAGSLEDILLEYSLAVGSMVRLLCGVVLVGELYGVCIHTGGRRWCL
jgi:hypothetical protein